MTKFDDHPTVKLLRSQQKSQEQNPQNMISSPLDRDWLRSFCLDLGADDVGFVSINQPEFVYCSNSGNAFRLKLTCFKSSKMR